MYACILRVFGSIHQQEKHFVIRGSSLVHCCEKQGNGMFTQWTALQLYFVLSFFVEPEQISSLAVALLTFRWQLLSWHMCTMLKHNLNYDSCADSAPTQRTPRIFRTFHDWRKDIKWNFQELCGIYWGQVNFWHQLNTDVPNFSWWLDICRPRNRECFVTAWCSLWSLVVCILRESYNSNKVTLGQ